MKKKLIRIAAVLIIPLIFANVRPGSAAVGGPVSVPDQWTPAAAIRFAFANNPDTAVTRQRIAAAEAMVQEANAAFFPKMDLQASYERTDNPMYSFGNILNQGEFDNSIDFNDPGPTDDLRFNANINYNLYNGGRDQAGLAAAQAKKAASMYQLAAVRSSLALAVVKSFFTIVKADETVQARKSAVEAIAASLHVAKSRYQAGDLLKADLLNLEVHHSEADENLIQARHGAELARKSFLNLLGLTSGPVHIRTETDIQQAIPEAAALQQRPEIKRLERAIEAAEAMVRQAQGGYFPSADAFAGYQVDRGFEYDGSGDSWQTGVRLNYNVFNGRRTEAQVARAKAELAETREQQRKLALAIHLEVEEARLRLAQAQQRLLVTEKMVEQAEESADLNRERFKEGLLLSSELIDVENRLTNARVRHTVARAAAKIAVAELRRAMGLDLFEIPAMPQTSVSGN